MSKLCIQCKQEKPTENFNKWKLGKDGLGSWCKQCLKLERDSKKEHYREYRQEYYLRNKQKICEQTLEWSKKHRDRRNEICKASRLRHIDSARLSARESAKRWGAKNTPYVRENSRKYRARKKGALICDVTPQQWKDKQAEFNNCCAYCKVTFSADNVATQDHIVPLIEGGNHTITNIVPACRSCNSKKQRRPLDVFLVEQKVLNPTT